MPIKFEIYYANFLEPDVHGINTIFVISSNIDDATAMINEKIRELIKTYCGLYREVDSADVKQIDRSKFATIIHSKYIS